MAACPFSTSIWTACTRARARSISTSAWTAEQLTTRIVETLRANGMQSDVHIRLMVTRGIKATPHQDPRFVIGDATIVIIPEYKKPLPATVEHGIRLFTVHVRRGAPDVQDPKLNSHSKLNCILACIQAQKAGYDEALMLDPHGFVATCNSTHFFIVRRGEVWTSTGDYCLGGITRANVIRLCRDNGIPVFEKNFSLTDVYGAEEAFVTGTFAGVVPVNEIDGRGMGDGGRGADGRAPAAAVHGPGEGREPIGIRAYERASRRFAHRDVVGATQHLHRDDARVGKPRGHRRHRRAVLRALPARHRRRRIPGATR